MLAAIVGALTFTAVPVVLDVPRATVAIAALAVIQLACFIALGPSTRSRRRVVAIAGLVISLVIGAVASFDGILSVRKSDVRFAGNGVQLAGTLFTRRSNAATPAVVMVHGSGPESRKEYSYYARLLARRGVAGLAYDKRGVGGSTGRLYEANYSDYASDADSAVEFLRRRGDIVPHCIGIMGFSEGEWTGALAASQSSDVAFLIVVSPSGVSPAQQVDEEIAFRLRRAGHSQQDVNQAIALNDRVMAYQRTGADSAKLQAAIDSALKQPWFRDAQKIPRQVYSFAEYDWWRSVMDFQPAPVWQRVRVPVLLLKGGRDPMSRADIARAKIESALLSGGNHNGRFVVFPDGDHALVRWPIGEKIPPPLFATGYIETLVNWVLTETCARRFVNHGGESSAARD